MKALLSTSMPELRDGVELFLYPQKEGICSVLFLFLSNRRRLRINCKPSFCDLLKELAKSQPLSASLKNAGLELDEDANVFLLFLEAEGIMTLEDPLGSSLLPKAYIEQFKRQVYFLIDVLKEPDRAMQVQYDIFNSHVTVLGLGAIGLGILQQLCMMGFRRFTLVDCAKVEANDIARNAYKITSELGLEKTQAASALVQDIAFNPEVELHDIRLVTTTNLEDLLEGTSFIVNTADEPYIGYSNIKLSRYALKHEIPLLAAGGFDAHLASLGELLIPYVTPCADCYATFFDENLKDWKPIPHPVKSREGWFGGLSSLSVFSASTATLEILTHYFSPAEQQAIDGERGEFIFHDYSLECFNVARDLNCQSCGEVSK